jgi:3-hydroxyisobutyrate dehydrogenase
MNVGIIGLGTMGGRAAKKMLEAGHGVLGCDTNRNAGRLAEKDGVRIVSFPRDLGEVEFVFLSLPGPAEVTTVMTEGPDALLDHLNSQSVIIDLSSVDPQTSRSMAEATNAEGSFYLDAPVLGRPPSVGNWILPVGGDKDALERAQKILSCIAANAVHVGPSGAGSAVKLLNNLMVGAMNAVIAESMALAYKFNLSPKILFDIIGLSEAPTNNLLFQVKGKKILEGDFTPSFKLDLLAKDNDLCVKEAGQLGIPLIIGRAVDTANKLAQRKGLGNQDTCVLYNFFTDLYGNA